ncbi:MAG: type II toxin-antitoxin system VapC family toxin [Acidobacteriota bacterium]|nr:type II toxin-antitoxin system VapC family toxin [Acidobacteriota bacterium]
MYILDTNIIGFSVYQTASHPLLVKNFRATKPTDRWISIVTAEELIAWRLFPLVELKAAPRSQIASAYWYFRDILAVIHVYHSQIMPFDESAYDEFLGMPGDVDVNDRRIAAIALVHDLTVVTHNESDFVAIKRAKPDLRIQNWVTTDYT